MEDLDFERRRELRKQKREEMRLEASRMLRNNDDEEEAARERRRRARQERLRSRESEDPSGQLESPVVTNSHSVMESVSVSSSYSGGGEDDDQALLDRMAKREERRQRRLKEALERQKQLDPTTSEGSDGFTVEKNNTEEEERSSSWRRGRYRDNQDEENTVSLKREEPKEEEQEEEEETAPEREEEEDQKSLRRSNYREMASPEEPKEKEKEIAEEQAHSVVSEWSNQAESANSEAEEDAVVSGEDEEVPEDESVDNPSENKLLRNDSGEDVEVSEFREGRRKHNGDLHQQEEEAPKQHRKPERTPSLRSPEVSASDELDDDARLEAERKLEVLKRRRDDAESEEFERMRQKQQEAEVELEELKRKREGRRKVLEEEERLRKQEEDERRAKEEEEKRKMKEEIERRRAEAAEKRQKAEDTVDEEGKPFKCVSPRGSSLKIGERAEFLNKSAQRSSLKVAHTPVVSKIDNRLEQYTSAAQRENKESRSPRAVVADLPAVTDVRNIKSMWERGNVFGSPGGGGSAFKEAAVIKTGVAGRINDWLNKTPESGKTSGGRPADLKPVDVTNKRSLWENKGATPTKMAGRGETKSVANGMGH